ncbi:hypothetical protein [Emticicia sp. SJ17W-69]|uniref:hypothetical protein n=1 Tax=Emticicia sp. SJ17W-69 TaxID=3421657 RepID=UPI003EB80FB0
MNSNCYFFTKVKVFYLIILVNFKVFAAVKHDTTSYVKIHNIGLNLSSRGFGAELGLKLREKNEYSLRVNVAYLSFTKPQSIKMDKGSSLDIFPQVSSVVIGSLIDYHPFKNKIFRLTGGFTYEIIQRYNVLFNSSTGLNLGGLVIASDDFGEIQFGIKWNRFRPYLGVGVGKYSTKKAISVGFDVGVSYMGRPKLNLGYEGFLETTTIDEEIKKIEKNMRGYSFYPYLAFQLRYNINPKDKKKERTIH